MSEGKGYLHPELKRNFCGLLCRTEEIYAEDLVESAVKHDRPDWEAIMVGIREYWALLEVKEKLKCRCPITKGEE